MTAALAFALAALPTISPPGLPAGPSPALPIGQDPCSESFLAPSPAQSGDEFGTTHSGNAIAVDGTLALVGAPNRSDGIVRSGAAFLFRKSLGVWNQILEIPSPSGGAFDQFGAAVSVNERFAAVGAPGRSLGAVTTGRAWIFEHAGNWATPIELVPTTQSGGALAIGARYGHSISLSHDRVVVGAPGTRQGGGTAHVFERLGGVWTQVAVLRSNSGEANNAFGYDVAFDVARVVVGAPREGASLPSTTESGAVHVFDKNTTGRWSRSHRFGADVLQHDVGKSVDVDGSRLVFGYTHLTGPGNFDGGVDLWNENMFGWSRESELRPTEDGLFGTCVDVEANSLWVGAPSTGTGTAGKTVVHSYELSGFKWTPVSRRVSPSGQGYGRSLAMTLDDVLISAAPGRVHVVPNRPFDVEEFCFCASSSCGNANPSAGCANATGSGARLRACGSTSASDDSLVLHIRGTEAFAFGMFFAGRTQTSPQIFGNGRLCIGDPTSLVRLSLRRSDSAGAVSEGPGVFGYGLFTPGETWNFQYWYRDTGSCAAGYNASNGVAVTFTP